MQGTVIGTGKPAYWMIPSNVTKVGAEAGYKIDFTTPNSKRKSLNRLLDGHPLTPVHSVFPQRSSGLHTLLN